MPIFLQRRSLRRNISSFGALSHTMNGQGISLLIGIRIVMMMMMKLICQYSKKEDNPKSVHIELVGIALHVDQIISL